MSGCSLKAPASLISDTLDIQKRRCDRWTEVVRAITFKIEMAAYRREALAYSCIGRFHPRSKDEGHIPLEKIRTGIRSMVDWKK